MSLLIVILPMNDILKSNTLIHYFNNKWPPVAVIGKGMLGQVFLMFTSWHGEDGNFTFVSVHHHDNQLKLSCYSNVLHRHHLVPVRHLVEIKK